MAGLLDGALTGLLGNGDASTTATGVNDGLLNLPNLSLPTLSFPTLSFHTLSLPGLGLPTTSSSQSTASASALTSASLSQPLSTTLSSSGTSVSVVSVPPTSTPPASTTQDVTTTGSDDVVHTKTELFTVAASASASPSLAAAHTSESFLQNKALSGTVFGLVGALGLVLLIVSATFFLRRRARNRLLDDAVSFDPGLLAAADNAEKGHSSNASLGTMGSGRPNGYGTYHSEPLPQQYPEYYGAPQNPQQQYYSVYMPPTTNMPPALAGTSMFPSQAPQHNIPRVPVPQAPGPLPAEFGSSDADNRRSIEESDFWARTLKVTNE
ncbi:hypothetical protein DFH07DRAFT_836531 [Mycena maculata]|uniref:Uncharacterized protein n=1 Tax=Mycena maculata TaxID=230809 RepID=A0AAD7II70_9AGAR|nr:hypothetical protein DFH07DRAFT_836531 [Mycena maculata]